MSINLRPAEPIDTGRVPHPKDPNIPMEAESLEMAYTITDAGVSEVAKDLAGLYKAMEKLQEAIKLKEDVVAEYVSFNLPVSVIAENVKLSMVIFTPEGVIEVTRSTTRSWDTEVIDSIYGAAVPDYISRNYSLTPAKLRSLPESEQLMLSDAIIWKPSKFKTKKAK